MRSAPGCDLLAVLLAIVRAALARGLEASGEVALELASRVVRDYRWMDLGQVASVPCAVCSREESLEGLERLIALGTIFWSGRLDGLRSATALCDGGDETELGEAIGCDEEPAVCHEARRRRQRATPRLRAPASRDEEKTEASCCAAGIRIVSM